MDYDKMLLHSRYTTLSIIQLEKLKKSHIGSMVVRFIQPEKNKQKLLTSSPPNFDHNERSPVKEAAEASLLRLILSNNKILWNCLKRLIIVHTR